MTREPKAAINAHCCIRIFCLYPYKHISDHSLHSTKSLITPTHLFYETLWQKTAGDDFNKTAVILMQRVSTFATVTVCWRM